MQKSNPRFLQSSPTAATLRQYHSVSSFDSVPPLVSIHDIQTAQQTHRIEPKAEKLIRKDDDIRFDKSTNKQVKTITSGNKERRESNSDNLIVKPKNQRASPKKIISSQINPNNHLYTSKLRNKVHLHPSDPNIDEVDKQQSYAESVYLDLQEYSSIHKYESMSPYYEQFEEDGQYVKYLGDEEKEKYRSIGTIPINLQGEESNTKLRMPILSIIDEYQQISPPNNLKPTALSPQNRQSPIRVKQTKSITFDEIPPQQINNRIPVPYNKKQILLENASKRIDQEADDIHQIQVQNQVSHKYSGEFLQYPAEIFQKIQATRKGGGELAALGLQVFNSCLKNRLLQSSKIQSTNQQQDNRIFSEIAPQWFLKNNTGNSLRLILTKPAKLTEYLKYLTELQIRIRKHKQNLEIKQLSNRADTKIQKNSETANKKQVTVHYDNSKQYLQTSNEKLKSSQPLSKKIVKQSITSIKSAQMNPMSYHLPSQTGKSSKSKSVFSDHISTFNVFTGSNHKNKNKQYPEVISQIHSQMDMESNGLEKSNKKSRVCKDEVDVLNILEVLLAKLRDKKCNIYIKQGNSSQTTGEDNISNISQKINTNLNLMQILNFNSPNILSLPSKTQISKIEFDEYLGSNQQGHDSGSKVANNTKRIRQLTQILEDKQKYLYEVKSGFDQVISNYITTIFNLKKGPESHEKEAEQAEDSKEGSNRHSQPITFQQSKHGSFVDQDQWIGTPYNPYAQQNQSDQQELNKLRHSLPEKN